METLGPTEQWAAMGAGGEWKPEDEQLAEKKVDAEEPKDQEEVGREKRKTLGTGSPV